MKITTELGLINIIILFGVIQGILLSFIFLKKHKSGSISNLFQGFLILSFSLIILEEWLNNTGLIVKVLAISNFSEPLNFVIAPLVYLHIKYSFKQNKNKREFLHFIPALIWLLYTTLYFIQPDEYKYNSFIVTKHPDWEFLNVASKINDDPIGLRYYVNQLTFIHLFVYLTLSVRLIFSKLKDINQTLFHIDNSILKSLRNTLIHYIIILVIYISTKLYFGMGSDIGNYFIALYISLMFYITNYQIVNISEYFNSPSSFMELPGVKYKRSSLLEEDKDRIQDKLRNIMEEELYFKNNLASLSELSRLLKENRHHLSQVINERFEKNYFELIAYYRIEEAKKLLIKNKRLTIEELAEEVGYNSKSSFNSAFKKYTGKTPSEYRN